MLQKLHYGLRFTLLALLIGLFSVIFAEGVGLAFTVFLHLTKILHYWLFLYIPCGFVAITYLVIRYFPEAAGSGIPQVLAAEYVNSEEKLKQMFYPRVIFSKFFAVILGTMFGATIGREGPTTRIGATILSFTQSKISLHHHKVLLKIGAAAGLAAAFNSPLGGAVFAMEELFKSSKFRVTLTKLAGIVLAALVPILIVGNNSYFGSVKQATLLYDPLKIIPIAMMTGVFAGVFAFIFSQVVHYTTTSPTSLYNQWKARNPLRNALFCGILVTVVGFMSHGLSYGNGYYESNLALAGKEQLPTLYVIYKMLGSVISTASGVPGGYFATALSIGEGVGGLVQSFINIVPAEQYYLLGMVAFLAAMTRAPVTAITMVLQVTASQVFLLPLMVAALVGTYIAQLFDKGIYHYQMQEFIQ